MQKFIRPRERQIDFFGILHKHDCRKVNKYISNIDQEIADIEKYLAYLKKQRSNASYYRLQRLLQRDVYMYEQLENA